jgi:hypothetical protein
MFLNSEKENLMQFTRVNINLTPNQGHHDFYDSRRHLHGHHISHAFGFSNMCLKVEKRDFLRFFYISLLYGLSGIILAPSLRLNPQPRGHEFNTLVKRALWTLCENRESDDPFRKFGIFCSSSLEAIGEAKILNHKIFIHLC